MEQQARQIVGWLGDDYDCRIIDGRQAFAALDDCQLLVVMGLHWSGMGADWAGNLAYEPLLPHHQAAFEAYIASGRPVLAHHGAIASYDDWPRFGELLGFTWVWGVTTHSPVGDHAVQVLPTGHPVVAGVGDYTLHDELYYDMRITPDLRPTAHAEATWDGRRLPMVLTAEGGAWRAPGALSIWPTAMTCVRSPAQPSASSGSTAFVGCLEKRRKGTMTQHDPAHRYRAAIIGVGKAGDLTAGRTGSYQIGYTHARSYLENPRIDLVRLRTSMRQTWQRICLPCGGIGSTCRWTMPRPSGRWKHWRSSGKGYKIQFTQQLHGVAGPFPTEKSNAIHRILTLCQRSHPVCNCTPGPPDLAGPGPHRWPSWRRARSNRRNAPYG